MSDLKLKILIVIFFLFITYSGGSTLTFVNFLWIVIGVFASFLDLFCFNCFNEQIEALKNLFVYILIVSTFFLIFKKNKFLILSCVCIQFLFIIHIFKISYIKNWYFTVPTTLFLIF